MFSRKRTTLSATNTHTHTLRRRQRETTTNGTHTRVDTARTISDDWRASRTNSAADTHTHTHTGGPNETARAATTRYLRRHTGSPCTPAIYRQPPPPSSRTFVGTAHNPFTDRPTRSPLHRRLVSSSFFSLSLSFTLSFISSFIPFAFFSPSLLFASGARGKYPLFFPSLLTAPHVQFLYNIIRSSSTPAGLHSTTCTRTVRRRLSSLSSTSTTTL